MTVTSFEAGRHFSSAPGRSIAMLSSSERWVFDRLASHITDSFVSLVCRRAAHCQPTRCCLLDESADDVGEAFFGFELIDPNS